MPVQAQGGGGGRSQVRPIRNPALEGGKLSAPRFSLFTSGNCQCPFSTRLGTPWAVWTVRKALPPLGFNLRAVQTAASRYTDMLSWQPHCAVYYNVFLRLCCTALHRF